MQAFQQLFLEKLQFFSSLILQSFNFWKVFKYSSIQVGQEGFGFPHLSVL